MNNYKNKPKLLDSIRDYMILNHYSHRTISTYCSWIKRFIIFNQKKHPAEMGVPEIRNYLNYLAVNKNVSASTQNLALQAILFLYKEILKKEIGWISDIDFVKKVKHIPTVFTRSEVKDLLSQLDGIYWLICSMLYGTGARLNECLRLRIKDIDFQYKYVFIYSGKGEKDRRTVLPETLITPLKNQIAKAIDIHNTDLKKGSGETLLPYALKEKYLMPLKKLDGSTYSFRIIFSLMKNPKLITASIFTNPAFKKHLSPL